VLSMLGIATFGTIGGGLLWRLARPAVPDPAVVALRPEQERRPILDPTRFAGKARQGYEVAHQIPGVLDRLKCYCRCEPYGHGTLLSCYTDNHAAT
jgi:hypothetical protein